VNGKELLNMEETIIQKEERLRQLEKILTEESRGSGTRNKNGSRNFVFILLILSMCIHAVSAAFIYYNHISYVSIKRDISLLENENKSLASDIRAISTEKNTVEDEIDGEKK
jgi:cell division septal protein FtsQ